MINYKKILCNVMVACIATSVIGCAAKTPKATTEGAPKLAPVELTYIFPGSYPQKDSDAVYAKLNEMTQKKINTKINYMGVAWGDFDNKVKMRFAAGEPVDLVFTSNWSNDYITNVAKGNLLALDPLLEKYGKNTYTNVPKAFWDATKINGKIYGSINYQISVRNTPLKVRKTAADQVGLKMDSITKLEDLEPLLDKVVALDKNLTTELGFMNLLFYYGYEQINATAAIKLNDASAKVVNLFKTEEYKSYIALAKKWADKNYVKGQANIAANGNADYIKKNTTVFFSGTWAPDTEVSESQKWFPLYAKALSDTYLTTGSVIATMTGIGASCKNPDRAMMFLELMNNDKDMINTLAFGIEGKHFTKVGNAVEAIKDAGYWPDTTWAFGNTFNTYQLKGVDPTIGEQIKKMNSSAKVSPIVGFSFSPDNVKTELANTNAVITELSKGFDNGLLNPVSDYKKFTDRLDGAGGDKIVQEAQKQIDAWKATKK